MLVQANFINVFIEKSCVEWKSGGNQAFAVTFSTVWIISYNPKYRNPYTTEAHTYCQRRKKLTVVVVTLNSSMTWKKTNKEQRVHLKIFWKNVQSKPCAEMPHTSSLFISRFPRTAIASCRSMSRNILAKCPTVQSGCLLVMPSSTAFRGLLLSFME